MTPYIRIFKGDIMTRQKLLRDTSMNISMQKKRAVFLFKMVERPNLILICWAIYASFCIFSAKIALKWNKIFLQNHISSTNQRKPSNFKLKQHYSTNNTETLKYFHDLTKICRYRVSQINDLEDDLDKFKLQPDFKISQNECLDGE